MDDTTLLTKQSRYAALKFLNTFEKAKKELVRSIIDNGEDDRIITALAPAFAGLSECVNEIATIYHLKFKRSNL